MIILDKPLRRLVARSPIVCLWRFYGSRDISDPVMIVDEDKKSRVQIRSMIQSYITSRRALGTHRPSTIYRETKARQGNSRISHLECIPLTQTFTIVSYSRKGVVRKRKHNGSRLLLACTADRHLPPLSLLCLYAF